MTFQHPHAVQARYLTPAQVCELIPGMTKSNLAQLRFKGAGPMAVGLPALNMYRVGSTPLIARRHAEDAVATLAHLMAKGRGLPRRWVFPHMVLDGPFMQLFAPSAQKHGYMTDAATTYRRAVLTRSAGDFKTHVDTVIGKKRTKDDREENR